MTLAPGRFDYAPINDRPIIKWPNNARVAFWVAPNMEFFEYLPENRPTQPDIPHYSRMDYGNRVGFWRMLDVLNRHKVRACCCLNLEILDHFPEIKDAMVAADWDYMAHGLYNSRPIYDLTEEQERAYWQDFITHLQEMTGKRLKGRLGGGAGYTVRTDDLMAEAGCLYHTSWIIDDQPWPINVRGGQKFIYVPYTGQTNDAGMLAWNREADYFLQMIKDQFDMLYREGAENGRVMCLSLHPHNIGRPNAAKHLDEALRYILGHDGVWNTTADDIAEYYIANYYDQVTSWIAERKARPRVRRPRERADGSQTDRQGRADHRFEPRHRPGDRQGVCRRGLPGDALGAFGRATARSGSGAARERRGSRGSRRPMSASPMTRQADRGRRRGLWRHRHPGQQCRRWRRRRAHRRQHR